MHHVPVLLLPFIPVLMTFKMYACLYIMQVKLNECLLWDVLRLP